MFIHSHYIVYMVEFCFLSYGQTGTGKTYTMEGCRGDIDDSTVGIIPRAIKHVFEELEKLVSSMNVILQYTSSLSNCHSLGQHFNFNVFQKTEEYSVRVSYLELYNEELYDLLAPASNDRERLRIFDDSSKKVFDGI